MSLPANSLTIITYIFGVICFLLYLYEYLLRRKSSSKIQQDSDHLREKSIQLLRAARLAETEVLQQTDQVSQKLVVEFENQLQDLLQRSQVSLTASQDGLIKYMESLQKRAEEFETSYQQSATQRIQELFDNVENRVAEFLIQTEQKSTYSIELELKAVRQLIETYRVQQLKLIDENIVAMMEQTLNIVLGKKLSLKDQLDLVYEALERAKIEKFIT